MCLLGRQPAEKRAVRTFLACFPINWTVVMVCRGLGRLELSMLIVGSKEVLANVGEGIQADGLAHSWAIRIV